jgi:hypothetical protein
MCEASKRTNLQGRTGLEETPIRQMTGRMETISTILSDWRAAFLTSDVVFGGRAPDPGCPVEAPQYEELAVGRHGQAHDVAGMALNRGFELSGGGIPQPYHIVSPTADQGLAGRREDEGGDGVGVGPLATARSPQWRIPEDEGALVGPRGERPPMGRERYLVTRGRDAGLSRLPVQCRRFGRPAGDSPRR